MPDPLLLYGATGYTGGLIAQALRAEGLQPILGGRDERRLAVLAGELGFTYRVAGLDDGPRLAAALDGIGVVLHCAGPFSSTAAPMAQACLARGVHYLDITAEVRVIESLARLDAPARRAGIMVMPAVGFDVVPSDCLAAHVARRLPGAERLAIALTGLELVTRGSAKTLLQSWDRGFARVRGVLTETPLGTQRRLFDFGDGPRPCLNVSWGDVASAYYTTGIPNIVTYCDSNPLLESALLASRSFGGLLGSPLWRSWLEWWTDALPEGPSDDERQSREMLIVAEAERDGARASARMRTPEAYSFTAVTSVAIARRALAGDLEPGFQTPARVYGPDFVCGLDGVRREDLP